MPRPLLLTKCIEIILFSAAISAKSPILPKWEEFFIAIIAFPNFLAFLIPKLQA